VVLIENTASGRQLIEELTREGFTPRLSMSPKATRRFNSQTAMIENGFILIPSGSVAAGVSGRIDGLSKL